MQFYEKSLTTELENNYVKHVTFQYSQTELLWYLPHHLVSNPNKPGKLRRGADAASMYKGVSLNSCLETESLTTCLAFCYGFGKKPVSELADSEVMFMQIDIKMKIKKLPLAYQKRYQAISIHATYLWYKMLTIHCHFALHKTAADYCVTKPNIAQQLHKNFYMDDFVHSFSSTNEATTSTTQLKSSLRQGDSTLLSSYILLFKSSTPLMETKIILRIQSWASNETQLTIRCSW